MEEKYCFVMQVWMDEFMQWDPEEFGGVAKIRLPGESIWTPDIILFNKYTTILTRI